MEIETKLGKILVTQSGWTNEGYPGYLISLKNNEGKPLAEVLFEVDENDSWPRCKIHIWDSTHEDPIYDFVGVAGKDEMLITEY